MENRVRVAYYREPRYFLEGHWRRYYRGHGFDGLEGGPKERGGQTCAEVHIGGHIYVGWAECSLKDSFCYSIGRKIAVGRLRKKIERLGYTITSDGFVEATDV